jgi:hypothetical protein
MYISVSYFVCILLNRFNSGGPRNIKLHLSNQHTKTLYDASLATVNKVEIPFNVR